MKDGRSAGSSGVRDCKHRLQEPVEIRRGHRSPFESQRFVAVVPPAVGYAGRKDACLSSSEGDGAGANAPAQHAAQHGAFLVLHHMNVQRGPGAVRRQRSFDLEDDLPARERLANILATLRDVLWSVDPGSGKMLYVSPAVEATCQA